MLKTLLSITARGGFKIGFIIFIISLFTSLAVAVNTISYSYANKAPILKEISGEPQILILNSPSNNSISIKIGSLKIGSKMIIIISSNNLSGFLNILHISFSGDLPEYGEALIGRELEPLISNDTIGIKGLCLNISGVITSPKQFYNTIVIADETAKTIKVSGWKQYYITKKNGVNILCGAPDLSILVEDVTREGTSSFSLIIYLNYILMTIAVIVEGYSVVLNTKSVFKVLTSLGVSNFKIISSLIILSILTSSISVVIGYAIGIFAPSIISSFLSITLHLPYVKPLVNPNLLFILLSSLILSSVSLAIGFARGYVSVLKSY